MGVRKFSLLALWFLMAFLVGCRAAGEEGIATTPLVEQATAGPAALLPSASAPAPTATQPPTSTVSSQPEVPTQEPSPTSTTTPFPTATDVVFEVGQELTVGYLQDLEISGSEITFEEELVSRANYRQYRVSYKSEGLKVFGLLTVPFGDPPEGGFKAIVFNHGYIPPATYRTTEKYVAYVDYLARSGFVVFKIDFRGHGQSQGQPTGTYFSPAYTMDAIAALKSLQQLDFVDPDGIGMWGHSMAGNLVLRAMLIEPEVQAGVIWSGAVYSYDDFMTYGITDNTYRPPATPEDEQEAAPLRRSRDIFSTYGPPNTQIAYWRAVSLVDNIESLNSPLQLHHAEDDPVVTINYSSDLAEVLEANAKAYEFYNYPGGGHNLNSPFFDQAMQRTVEFFRNNL